MEHSLVHTHTLVKAATKYITRNKQSPGILEGSQHLRQHFLSYHVTVLEAGFWLSLDNFPGTETSRFVKLFPVKNKILLLIFRKGISSEIKDMET